MADGGRISRTGTTAGKITLHLGVTVLPYRNWELQKNGRRKAGSATPITTFDVATILEAKYGLFSTFYRVKQPQIAKAMAKSLQGSLESLLMGSRTDPYGGGMQQVQQMFRDFISTRESERVGIPGTPTKAALRGVNHRLKHPYSSRNPRRPSFKDTGTLMAAFKSWVDG